MKTVRRIFWHTPAAIWLCTVLAIVGLFLSTGCSSTVSPGVVRSEQASWDGTERNSGVIRVDAAIGGFVVTEHFISRYDALVAIYGDAKDAQTRLAYFTPALERRSGVSRVGSEWVVSPQAMAAFLRMNQWKKAGRYPL